MQRTTNLQLYKPESTDNVDITKINANMDTLDTAVTGKMAANVTSITASQIAGGLSKTYDISVNTYKTVLELGSTQYWTTSGGHAYMKFLLTASTVASGTAPSTSNIVGTWIVEVVFSGVNHVATVQAITQNAGTTTGTLRYLGIHSPISTSYGCCFALACTDTSSTVHARIDILSASAGWSFPSTAGGDPGTTNYNRTSWEIGRYNYVWSNVKGAMNITGSCDGRAGNTWDTILDDRYKYGEACVAGSLVAMGSDGLLWKLRNTNKEFRLPLEGGRCTGTFAVNQNYGALNWSVRGIALTELTNTSMQTTAFTVPTWAVGNTIYARGSLSNGNFKPDGTLSNAMANGYTWVPIGKVEKINSDAVTYMSLFMMRCSAYTLNSSGALTHIDGKAVKDDNTDTKVRQTLQTGNYNLPLLLSYQVNTNTTANVDNVCYRNNSIYANPSTGKITATGFVGALTGNADTATKLGTATKGSSNLPIYLNAGVPTAISIDNTTTVGSLMNLSTWSASTNLITRNVVAHWDGRYQTTNNASNLAYCKKGAFGDAATYGIGSVSSGNNGLVKGGDAYTAMIRGIAQSSRNRSNSVTDLLNISINGVSDSDGISSIAVENTSSLSSSPVTSGAFYATRVVYKAGNNGSGQGSNKTTVQLIEHYPVSGRMWFRTYNPDTGDWTSNWAEHNPSNYCKRATYSGTTVSQIGFAAGDMIEGTFTGGILKYFVGRVTGVSSSNLSLEGTYTTGGSGSTAVIGTTTTPTSGTFTGARIYT